MNDVTLLVLASLSDGPKHGYAIQADVAAFAGIRLGPGTLYGAIARLEREGLIEAGEEEQRRRPYRISASGRDRLRDRVTVLSRVVARAALA